ncbi:oxidoreductase HTATIP2-like [Dreissena polymorpha]|uniref:Protein HTATIP2 n=1 Tax=Dreissena polymorpha TaxID=45954 RepID=A0A9D4B5S0_DREPO|nr:oxidoreductase HTATIP2-like [Dreissena polymorpha]KAH3690277.1 hypothetical protein DPMN_192156 [Dreissena polymorpha]
MSTVFVVGYTGATGKAVVNKLFHEESFKRIVLIGRRKVTLTIGDDPRFEQKEVDFDKLDDFKDVFRGCDTGFCCLGTTRSVAGKEGFIRVDRDYVVNCARIAKETGCRHFQVVSSTGTNKNSCLLYPKTKGEMEERITDMGFQRLTIYRPGFLLTDREETRIGEKLVMCCMFPVFKLCPTAGSVHVDLVAQAMINNAKRPFKPEGTSIIPNALIHEWAHS